MSRRAIQSFTLKGEAPMQSLKGSPQGQHTEHHFAAGKSLTLEFDDVTGLIHVMGWGDDQATHVSNAKTVVFATKPAEVKK